MFNFGNKKGRRHRGGKKLVRLDAVKNIDYDASFSSDESTSLQASRSLDFSPQGYSDQSSFRIGGSREGEVEHLYESLGLSGPEDFAIPLAAWEASLKFRSSSDVLPRSRLLDSEDSRAEVVVEEIRVSTPPESVVSSVVETAVEIDVVREEIRVRDVGIKGPRPPSLTPPLVSGFPLSPVSSVLPLPPSMLLPVLDRASSTWDIVRSFAPGEENEGENRRRLVDSDEEEDDDDDDDDHDEGVGSGGAGEVLERVVLEVETSDGTGSFSTSVDDDSSSTTTEFVISPNGRFKKKIRSWMRGHLLGSGSFGTVYEGISE